MLRIGPNNNSIEFQIEIENTTFDKIQPRLVVEVSGNSILIPLKVDKNGIVKGDIPLKENWNDKEGKLKLEIINESNYFVPFEQDILFEGINPTPKTIVKEAKTISKTPKVTAIPTLNLVESQIKVNKEETESLIKETKEFLKVESSIEINSKIKDFFKDK